MGQDGRCRKAACPTRHFVSKKIQGFHRPFHLLIVTICVRMSLVFLPPQGENADKLSHVEKYREALAAFCYLNRDTFITLYTTYQTDAKMWANQSSELTE